MAMNVRHYEGVPYYRHVVRFRTRDGKRRQRVVWSPGHPWVRTEVARMLDAEIGIENIAPGSATIRQESPR